VKHTTFEYDESATPPAPQGGEVTRTEWSARPMAERQIAAEAWCQGWNDAVIADAENLDEPERSKFNTFSQNVTDHFALDLPDAPEAVGRDERAKYEIEGATKAMRQIGRIEVVQFARDMERKLKANEHKSHWSGMTPPWLLRRLRAETNELARALKAKNAKRVIDESADVGNFAMMLADKARAHVAAAQSKGDDHAD